jgi:hypothetical protein
MENYTLLLYASDGRMLVWVDSCESEEISTNAAVFR